MAGSSARLRNEAIRSIDARRGERVPEEVGLAAGDAHRREDRHEALVAEEPRAGRDPGRELVGRQAGAGEDRQLLAADEAGQQVDRADRRSR